MPNEIKSPKLSTPVNEVLANRWSPYVFSDKAVDDATLKALFEAAHWAPSSYNEQPWRYIVAKKSEAKGFAKALDCLVEGNQGWAKTVPVLVFGVYMKNFSHNGKENAAAPHDLGAASMSLCIEATARGLAVHQMSGILPEKVEETYGLPEDAVALTAIAIGHFGNPDEVEEPFRTKDKTPRERNPLNQCVFQSKWGNSAAFTE